MTATATDTERVDRLAELRKSLDEKIKENETIVGTAATGDKDAGVDIIVTPEMRESFAKNVNDIREIRELIKGLEVVDESKRYLDGPDGHPLSIAAAAAAGMLREQSAPAKSVGQLFVESEQFKSLDGGKAGLTMREAFEIGVHDMPGLAKLAPGFGGRKDVYTSLPGGTPGDFGRVERDPFVERARRRVRVRDLFPARSTDARVIEYFRVTGFTNNASVVPERTDSAFTAKPQSSLTFTGEQAVVRTIAHWEAAHRNVLADEPQLRGLIDSELLYGLQLHEDYQILQGTGTGEDLDGILNDDDIQTYSQSSGPSTDNKADAIRRAMTLSLLAFYEPTGVVLHDGDLEDIELAKATTGEYLFLTALAVGVEPRIHRLPVVSTPAMPEGTGLVGAFGTGAQLYDREEGTIRVAEQHSDFFVRNAVVVLAEERLALAVKRPEAFVAITFS